MKKKVVNGFKEVFQGAKEPRVFFSPGRVNLIGEHTDYNGGYVFPCALTVGTYVAVAPRDDNELRLYSGNFEEKGTISLDLTDLSYREEHDWANYVKGVIVKYAELGHTATTGFDAYFYGNIPNGAGLSSSASIELATAIAWDSLHSFGLDRIPMVQLCQRAENEYIGVNCGIMDQFAIGMGKDQQAILLDCDTLDYSYAPVELGDYKLVIANTNKRRGLADSKYNERRGECEQAASILGVDHLCELTPADFEEKKSLIEDATVQKRAKHAIYENARTVKAQKALEEGDIAEFGELMNASHISLRDDYEVTGQHLDALVQAAWDQPEVIGSRMTGAGFGGCTVSLVKKSGIDDTLTRISKHYEQAVGMKPDFYIVGIGDGTKELV
ncbi:galactokinase [Paenalkalicoccus suaedae]|uniref:Galactokinase n=1 Tax=Paenalkalicoccus suaedae TaxID=2592382 RepID=A0A859FK33_9BACI|nr:galactokinase [Paenalkalicoccus suaedae]QKS73162.1 galactokinase [Paenalkalicoccus suaedae]